MKLRVTPRLSGRFGKDQMAFIPGRSRSIVQAQGFKIDWTILDHPADGSVGLPSDSLARIKVKLTIENTRTKRTDRRTPVESNRQ